MRLFPDVHPEFGYLGSTPCSWRKLGIVVCLLGVFGLAADATASKLVPPRDLKSQVATAPTPAEAPVARIAPAQIVTNDFETLVPTLKPTCRGRSAKAATNDCISTRGARANVTAPTRPRRDTVATVKASKPGRGRVASVPAQRQSAHQAARKGKSPGSDDDVVSHHGDKDLDAFAQTLGTVVPKFRDLAGEM